MSVASPAFIDLCQAQFQLLHQTLGSISAVVYTTEVATATPPDFVPVFRYPQTEHRQSLNMGTRQLPETTSETFSEATSGIAPKTAGDTRESATQYQSSISSQTIPDSSSVSDAGIAETVPSVGPSAYPQQPQPVSPSAPSATPTVPESLHQTPSDQRLVLPLIHQETVVGAMVILHHERQWRRHEQRQIQQVADGIAAGYILERQNQWLQQQLQEKRQLQGQQSEIFHNLLHQFRNPLTALGTFGKLLLKRLPDEDPNRSIATSILRESERLNGLVDDFDYTVEMGDSDWQSTGDLTNSNVSQDGISPTLTKIDAPRPTLPSDSTLKSHDASHPQLPPAVNPHRLAGGLGHDLNRISQPLRPLVEPLLALGQTLAIERQLRFTGQLLPRPLAVTVDAQALQEVLRNLLDNALKYSRAGDWVWIQMQADSTSTAPRVGIAVGDTGVGIPLSDQQQLFERNYRGIQATGSIPGTGLGLAIARDLLTQMQGQIELISPISEAALDWVPPQINQERLTDSSGGTLFIVWLPLDHADGVDVSAEAR